MASEHELRERERELTRQIEEARKARRQAKRIHYPKGLRGRSRRFLASIGHYIAERVKNRARVREELRSRSQKPTSGPDVSQHQGSVDWRKVREAGHDFAFTKATEGQDFVDPTLSRARLEAMANAGLRVGAYHFARPDTAGGTAADAQAEANDFVEAVESRGGDFIGFEAWKQGAPGVLGVLDFEIAPFSASWASTWAARFRAATGVDPVIYGYGSSLNPIEGILDHFGSVWIAAYVSDWRPFFAGRDELVSLWQHTADGSCPGISGPCDLNRYVG